jgi:hypothetical protein
MAQVLWHLSRGPGHQTVISGETLRRLAELGKVDANDLLWRPGLRSWISARSVSGLTPPPRPSERSSVSFRSRVQEIARLIRHHLARRWRPSLDANDWCRSAWLHTRVYARGVYRYLKRVELGVETLFSHKERHRILAGMLAALVLVGMGTVIAMREAPADARVASQNSASMQPNAEATAATSPNAVEAEPHLQEAAADRSGTDFDLSSSIVSLQLLSGESAIFDPATELLSNSDPVPLPTRNPAAESFFNSDPVPLPTRKPVAAAKSVNTVEVERTGSVRRKAAAVQKRARQPKAPPFGKYGFNYSPL